MKDATVTTLATIGDVLASDFSALRRELAHACSVPDVTEHINRADMLRVMAQKIGASLEVQNECAAYKLDAARKAGDLLAAMDVKTGRPRKLSGDETVSSPDSFRLDDLGIDRRRSHEWQRIAGIPAEPYERYKTETRARGKEITQAGVLRMATELERDAKRAANRALVDIAAPVQMHVAGQVHPTIVLDPPWDWGDEGDDDQFGRGRPTYDTMPLADIAALPVSDLASINAHCYLWITNRSLPKGFALLDGWGFRYVTMLTWTKPSIGMGNYYRGSTEHVLFGVRGSLPLLRSDVGTWFAAPRTDQHSGKPDAFYALVESCSPGPWLELFARRERAGWVHWGADVS